MRCWWGLLFGGAQCRLPGPSARGMSPSGLPISGQACSCSLVRGLVVFAVEAFTAEEEGRDVVGLAGGGYGDEGW